VRSVSEEFVVGVVPILEALGRERGQCRDAIEAVADGGDGGGGGGVPSRASGIARDRLAPGGARRLRGVGVGAGAGRGGGRARVAVVGGVGRAREGGGGAAVPGER